MKMPNPKATTTTEAYLAYKAGAIAEDELKPKLYHPYIHLDGWLAYWCGLVDTYPTDKNGDPECLTDEEAYIAYLANVTNAYPLNLKDPADPRVAGYLRYLIAAKFGRPNYPVTREEFYLSIMKPPVVGNLTPASSIELDGVITSPFISLEAYGDTSQATYTGKNKLNPFLGYPAGSKFTSWGITYTLNGDGTFTVNGTSTGDSYWNFNNSVLVDGTGMKLVIELVDGNLDGTNKISLRAYKDGTGANQRVATLTSGQEVAYSPEMVAERYSLIRLSVSDGDTVNNVRVRVMMVPVDATTDYEPYVGGVASPNPDYPQEVKTVTGRQVVAVTGGDSESAEYELNLGKNLLKLSGVQSGVSGNGVRYTITDSKIILDGTTTRDGYIIATTPLGVKLSAGNYMYSIRKVGGSFTVPVVGQHDAALYIRDENNNRLTETAISAVNSVGYRESRITVFSDKELSIQLFANHAGIKFDNFELELQLEKGTVATSYAPYFEPIELCKIGDFQDYIYRDLAGNWKIHKAVGKKVFDGSESWEVEQGGTVHFFYKTPLSPVAISGRDVNDIFSNYGIGNYVRVANTEEGIMVTSSGDLVRVRYGSQLSVSDWKAKLVSNSMLLYYPLGVATDEELTNEELIAQLDALMEGGSYEGTTHITVSSEDLPALLKVEAAKDV